MDAVFAKPRIVSEQRPDGSIHLASAEPLTAPAPHLAALLRRWADQTPDAVLAAQWHEPDGWRSLTYRQAREQADALGEALLTQGLGAARPLLILSDNSLAHLVLTLAAYTAGVPLVPLSTGLSLLSPDHRRLRETVRSVQPGAIYAEDGETYGPALAALRGLSPVVITSRNPPDLPHTVGLAELLRTPPTNRVESAYRAVRPHSVAKILFTSGSTGDPKGVVNTHGMLCADQQMMRQVWPFLRSTRPILVDWLPWSHTFGGNHNLHLVLASGGTLYIDDGGPTPELFPRSVRNLRNAAPNLYFNVPAGFRILLRELEADTSFATTFFTDLKLMFSAGAALAEPLRRRLLTIADRVTDHEVRFTTSWGLTETAPAVTSAHLDTDEPGAIGVPLPGLSLKLAPVDGRLEMRVKGPNVLPGYYKRPDLDAVAFDEEGYFRTGDAGRLINPADPGQGLVFEGRLSEDFQLATGAWVQVTPLRSALLSATDLLADVVILGEGKTYPAALGWPAGGTDRVDARGALGRALAELNRDADPSRHVGRLLILDEPTSQDAGERSDKGSINQRRVIERRPAAVELLYREPAPAEVIVPVPAVPQHTGADEAAALYRPCGRDTMRRYPS
ncbi:AMP-binding protein [Embleya sp. AB8]|uniref:AMP-binding protein n=1 Tax=Embleya sp. AB8 TaxID=3156304 RepID=UPI003C78F733